MGCERPKIMTKECFNPQIHRKKPCIGDLPPQKLKPWQQAVLPSPPPIQNEEKTVSFEDL